MTDLYEHQLKCIGISRMNTTYGFMLDTGTGKTRLGLNIAKESDGKTLVLTKLSIIGTWIDEYNLIDMGSSKIAVGWARTAAERYQNIISGKYDILVMNYDSFKREIDVLQSLGFDTLICDESSALKNHKTQTSKSVLRFSKSVRRCYLLSGSPAPNGEHEWYTQMKCLENNGEIVFPEKSFYQWQRRWFTQPNPWQQPYLWELDKDRREEFIQRIKTKCIFISKSDCLDLPDQIWEKREVYLSPKEDDTYGQIEEDWICKYEGSTIIAQNSLVEAMKLRQITGGFSLPTYNEDMGEVDPIHIGNSKARVLIDTLEELGRKQALIFIQFRHEAAYLKGLLHDNGYTAECIIGGTDPSDRRAIVEDFTKGELKYIIGNPSAMGHGLNLQASSTAIWYSLSYSSELWKQANDRIHRAGQTEPCLYISLISRRRSGASTIDSDIYSAVRGKLLLSNLLLDRLKK